MRHFTRICINLSYDTKRSFSLRDMKKSFLDSKIRSGCHGRTISTMMHIDVQHMRAIIKADYSSTTI